MSDVAPLPNGESNSATRSAVLPAPAHVRYFGRRNDRGIVVLRRAVAAAFAQLPKAAAGAPQVMSPQQLAYVVVNPDLSGPDARLTRLARMVAGARLSGKPVALVGVTADKPRSRVARHLISKIVQKSDLVLVGDHASADALTEIGVEPPFRIGADPAWLELSGLYAPSTESHEHVVIALAKPLHEFVNVREWVQALKQVRANGLQVLIEQVGSSLLPSRAPSPRSIGYELPETRIYKSSNLSETKERYVGCRLVVAGSAYSLMAAASAGAPVVAIDTDSAIRRLATSLSVPLIPSSARASSIAEVLAAALDSQPVSPCLVRSHIDRAQGSVDLVTLLLTGGSASNGLGFDSVPLYPQPWRA